MKMLNDSQLWEKKRLKKKEDKVWGDDDKEEKIKDDEKRERERVDTWCFGIDPK